MRGHGAQPHGTATWWAFWRCSFISPNHLQAHISLWPRNATISIELKLQMSERCSEVLRNVVSFTSMIDCHSRQARAFGESKWGVVTWCLHAGRSASCWSLVEAHGIYATATNRCDLYGSVERSNKRKMDEDGCGSSGDMQLNPGSGTYVLQLIVEGSWRIQRMSLVLLDRFFIFFMFVLSALPFILKGVPSSIFRMLSAGFAQKIHFRRIFQDRASGWSSQSLTEAPTRGFVDDIPPKPVISARMASTSLPLDVVSWTGLLGACAVSQRWDVALCLTQWEWKVDADPAKIGEENHGASMSFTFLERSFF